jgi:hypothetical protein
MSIESITREVGRARHLVVHILQSKGVFGKSPLEPGRSEFGLEPVDADSPNDRRAVAERKPEPEAVGPQGSFTGEGHGAKARRVRRSKPAERPDAEIPVPSSPGFPAVERPETAGTWSPLVVDALRQVVTHGTVEAGMTIEEVQRMVSNPRRSRTARA